MSYLKSRELLTEEQRKILKEIPCDLDMNEMAAYYSFSEHDIKIINSHRRDHNRLGFAVQLSILRYPGWQLSDIETIPYNVLEYIAKQLNINPDNFSLYAKREPTKREHLDEIRREYGYKNFSLEEHSIISNVLFEYALENGNAMYLIKIALEELRKMKIIIPSISTIEKIVWEVRNNAEDKIYNIINNNLTEYQKLKLDDLLNDKTDKGITYFAWLKEVPHNYSPETFIKVIDRLEYLRSLNINLQTSKIYPNRMRQLSRLGSRYEPYALKKFDESKRYSILVIYLLDLEQDLIDYAIEIHDKQINNLLSKGRKNQEEIQKYNGKAINEKIINYANLVKALVKAKSEGSNPFEIIENLVMKWDELVVSGKEAEKLARPVDYDYLDLITNRFGYLRKYTPTLLKSLKFKSNQSKMSLIRAINVIDEMNKLGKRNVPEDAPIDFIPDRWLKHVFSKDGAIQRQYYELVVLSELRNCIRSGDISVVGSRKYRDFDDYLIKKDEWKIAKEKETKLAVSMIFEEYIEERIKVLNEKIKYISENIGTLNGITIEKDEIHVSRLEKDTPDEAKALSKLLYSMLPRIKLVDLLFEVDNWTSFTDQFIHASTGKKPSEEEKTVIIAALMAMGTNVGLLKMAEATTGITYYQMANSVQWRMYEDAFNKAQSILVNFHHSLSLPYYWGDGSTSSSDGMRVPVRVSSFHSEHNPHYGSGKEVTIYRWVSDQLSSYYVQTVITNTRDALYFIDGLLHHETDLDIKEHYTDTAGYSDLVFGLSHILGFKFAPRIRDLSDLKLYTLTKLQNYDNIDKFFKARINLKVIKRNFDDVLRFAYSIREGKVSSSLIISKLGSYARQNNLSLALKEMGRIEKTIFILEYISDEAFRRRINKGLNKGEATNALARAVFFGKLGEFYERELKDQLQRSSALNIIINAISVWNTVYLEKAIQYLKENNLLDEKMLSYISPLNWEHINFLGQYNFNVKNINTITELRPLNIPSNLIIT